MNKTALLVKSTKIQKSLCCSFYRRNQRLPSNDYRSYRRKRIRVDIEGIESIVYYEDEVKAGDKLQVLLRPEDLRIEEIKESEEKGIVGHVTDRTYKGMTLESVVELESGMCVMVSEFFNEDDPDVDHSIGQKVAVTWVESWEVVLNDEQKA